MVSGSEFSPLVKVTAAGLVMDSQMVEVESEFLRNEGAETAKVILVAYEDSKEEPTEVVVGYQTSGGFVELVPGAENSDNWVGKVKVFDLVMKISWNKWIDVSEPHGNWGNLLPGSGDYKLMMQKRNAVERKFYGLTVFEPGSYAPMRANEPYKRGKSVPKSARGEIYALIALMMDDGAEIYVPWIVPYQIVDERANLVW